MVQVGAAVVDADLVVQKQRRVAGFDHVAVPGALRAPVQERLPTDVAPVEAITTGDQPDVLGVVGPLKHVQKTEPQVADAEPRQAVELVVEVVVLVIGGERLVQHRPVQDRAAPGGEDAPLAHPEPVVRPVGIAPAGHVGQPRVGSPRLHRPLPRVQVVVAGDRVGIEDDHVAQRPLPDPTERHRIVVHAPHASVRRMDRPDGRVLDPLMLMPDQALEPHLRIVFQRIVDDREGVHLAEVVVAEADVGPAAVHDAVVQLGLRPANAVCGLRVQHAVAAGVVEREGDGADREALGREERRQIHADVLVPAPVEALGRVVAHVPAVGTEVRHHLPRLILPQDRIGIVLARPMHGAGDEVHHLDQVVIDEELRLRADVDRQAIHLDSLQRNAHA